MLNQFAFTCCTFTLSLEELETDGPEGHPSDVFLLCKHYMHSTCLTQKPTLLLPANRLEKIGPAPTQHLPRNTLSERQLGEFKKTARLISEAPWSLTQASNYLMELCDNNQAQRHQGPPELKFFVESQDTLRLRESERLAAGPPEELLTFAPGTPKKVVVNLHPVPKPKAKPKANASGKGRGRGRGRGRADQPVAAGQPVDVAAGEPVADDQPVAAGQPVDVAPPLALPPPADELPAQDLENAETGDAAADPELPRVMKRPAAKAPAVGPGAAPAAKRCNYSQKTIDQQKKLGCSKCKNAPKGCARCREIHELWKAKISNA